MTTLATKHAFEANKNAHSFYVTGFAGAGHLLVVLPGGGERTLCIAIAEDLPAKKGTDGEKRQRTSGGWRVVTASWCAQGPLL